MLLAPQVLYAGTRFAPPAGWKHSGKRSAAYIPRHTTEPPAVSSHSASDHRESAAGEPLPQPALNDLQDESDTAARSLHSLQPQRLLRAGAARPHGSDACRAGHSLPA